MTKPSGSLHGFRTRQWRLFGPDFSLLYLREGVDACGNYFEQQAGLESGGYDCP